jgi:hypothetical protein
MSIVTLIGAMHPLPTLDKARNPAAETAGVRHLPR